MHSESTQLQGAVDEALFAARAARQSREEFLARMSHEFRTPLNAVIGFSRLLEANKAGNQRPEDIDMIRRVRAGGEQLLRLIDNVLEQSEATRGELELNFEPTDVGALAEQVIAEYRNAAAGRGLRLVAVLPPESPMIHIDPKRFAEVLGHLLDNAIKFTVSGSVRVVLISDAATGRPLRISVADTGIGITPDELKRIFQPFEQGDNSLRRAYGGSGLGLALARRLCHAMDCELIAESQPGKGSRFTVRFPRAS